MSSRTIQKNVVHDCMRRGNKIAIENIYYWPWECDVLALTKSQYLYEYEVKISRSDFMADFKKTEKHRETSNGQGANYFYYVTPEGLVKSDEVPEHAGLKVKTKWGNLRTVKKAPMLHNEKVNGQFWEKIAMKLFWKTV